MKHANSIKYFEGNKKAKEFYWTSDGKHFSAKEAADAYGTSLKKYKGKSDEVNHVTREECAEELKEPVTIAPNIEEQEDTHEEEQVVTVQEPTIEELEQAVTAAQAAYDKASTGGVAEDIINAKKVLTKANGALTKAKNLLATK